MTTYVFQDEGKFEDEKEAFMRAVRCDIMEGAQVERRRHMLSENTQTSALH